MKQKLSTYWRLFWHFRRLRFMAMTEYRGDFFFWTFISTMWAIINFFSFSMLVGVNGQIGGWSSHEVYLLLSVFTILDAVIWDWLYQNMDEYRRLIASGEFTFVLLKPINPEFLLLTQHNSYNNVPRLFLGIGALIYATNNLGIPLTLSLVLQFIAMFATSVVFLGAIWFVLTTLALWLERIENINEIIPSMRQLWQVPGSVYNGIVSTFLTYVIPVTLITTLPSQVLLGKADTKTIAIFLAVTLFTVFLSKRFFRYSLTKFQGVGG